VYPREKPWGEAAKEPDVSKTASTFFPCLLALVLAGPVIAVDGVVEISHAAIAAGGITPSDTPGYPATIDHSGSYRLTSNLSPGTNQDGVEITADGVTLDLNGFSIKGPTVVICPPGGCPPNFGVGVLAPPPRKYTTVRNGFVARMGSHGIYVDAQSRVEGVTASENGGNGIALGPGSIAQGNVAHDNQGYGIGGVRGALVIENTALDNLSFGLACAFSNGRACAYGHNTFVGNNQSSAAADQVLGGYQIGVNVCEDGLCP
jgi:hypothetical protein